MPRGPVIITRKSSKNTQNLDNAFIAIDEDHQTFQYLDGGKDKSGAFEIQNIHR